MIFLIVILLVAEGISCQSTTVTGNEEIIGKPDDNSILESIRERDTKPSSPRSRRTLDTPSTSSSGSSSTEANARLAYETAINQTISDYYAQRKAVMDRYYARQRAIAEKFSRKTPKSAGTTVSGGGSSALPISTTVKPIITTTTTTTTEATTIQRISERNATVATPEDSITAGYDEPDRNGEVEDNGLASARRGTDGNDDNSQPDAWLYRSNNWNPRITDRDSDVDLQPESSNTLERSVHRTAEIPGYYKLGNFRGTKDEKVVYQHNLGVGLKGSSQLDATFEAVIEGPYEITIVEAFPYANTRANFTWLSGGPGSNFVKLKLQGYENEGFSYSVKVWGVPKTKSR